MASLYIHIPFCERKCLYCDFYSVDDTGLGEEFLAALQREISLRADYADRAVFETVLFGGGTPSLLEPRQLDSILSHLRAAFAITADAEITLEANPGTVSEETFRGFRSSGVNRLSIGIQSFHDEVSNFALPGFRCRHNCNYWSHEDYLGFGPSAHSFWMGGSCV